MAIAAVLHGAAWQRTPSERNPGLGGAEPEGGCPGLRNGITCRISRVASPTITRSIRSCEMLCFSSKLALARRNRKRSQNVLRSPSTSWA